MKKNLIFSDHLWSQEQWLGAIDKVTENNFKIVSHTPGCLNALNITLLEFDLYGISVALPFELSYKL